MLAVYPEVAALERMRSERPSRRTVSNVVMGVKRVAALLDQAEGLSGGRVQPAVPSMQRPIADLTRSRLDGIILMAGKMGLKPITAWSYVSALKGLTARWCLPRYHDRGWKVDAIELPPCRRRAPR